MHLIQILFSSLVRDIKVKAWDVIKSNQTMTKRVFSKCSCEIANVDLIELVLHYLMHFKSNCIENGQVTVGCFESKMCKKILHGE